MTGISPETLRMWERRYGIPSPARSDTGIRTYSDGDLERLRLIAKAIEVGYRPREVVPASVSRLRTITAEASTWPARAVPRATGGDAGTAGDVLAALEAYDVTRIETMLRRRSTALGARRFVVDLAAPLVQRVGERWEQGTIDVRHEHVFSEILTAHLHALRAQCTVRDGAARVLLATLPNELHGLGMEMVALYLAAQGVDARVLGVNTPPREIARAAQALGADAVGVSISSSAEAPDVARSIDEILPELPRRVPLWLGGEGAQKVRKRLPGVQQVPTWKTLDEAVAALEVAGRT